jgi:uncharacterized protein (TIGR03083 family)
MTEARAIETMADDEQAEFVELASALTPQEWSAPSLCAGLSVRDVLVHIAAHIHDEPNTKEIVRTALRVGPSISRIEKRIDRIQHDRHAGRSPESIVIWLAEPRAFPDSPTQLSELVIHQQDIRRAIDRPRVIPPERVRAVLDHSTSKHGHKGVNYARRRLSGLRLVATDMDWTWGEGAEISGPGEALLMAVNGRDQALLDLSGAGLEALTRRTTKWSSRFSRE